MPSRLGNSNSTSGSFTFTSVASKEIQICREPQRGKLMHHWSQARLGAGQLRWPLVAALRAPSPSAPCARALHRRPGPHLNLVTVLEGEVSLPVLLAPRAILLRVAHDSVDVPVAVEARVEVQHEGAAVLPHVHSKPGETKSVPGRCSSHPVQAEPTRSSITPGKGRSLLSCSPPAVPHQAICCLLAHPLASDRIFPLTLMHSPGSTSS